MTSVTGVKNGPETKDMMRYVKLTLKVTSAELIRSTDMMGKMDPYVVVQHTSAVTGIKRLFRGPTHKAGHLEPKWDWECTFYLETANAKEFSFTVYEQDLTSSDLIGTSAQLSLSEISQPGLQQIGITHEKKQAGTISLSGSVTDIASTKKPLAGFKAGTLHVKAVGANLLVDTDLFTKMDQFLRLEMPGVPKQSTKTHENSGKVPVWNETFKFDIKSDMAEQTLTFTLVEEGIDLHDDIGTESLKVALL